MDFKDVIELVLWVAALFHIAATGWHDINDRDEKVTKHAALACMAILVLQGMS